MENLFLSIGIGIVVGMLILEVRKVARAKADQLTSQAEFNRAAARARLADVGLSDI